MEHLYIHIPFCKHICSYCDFCKLLKIDKFIDDYLDGLEKEINEYYNGELISTIYIGGGTPSCLSIKQLNRLFNIIKVIKLNKDYEFTFEINPDDITEELINLLVLNNVNRVSIGVESFDIDKLGFMERSSNYKDIKDKIDMIRLKGIKNINLDLIYGIPLETLKVLKNDLKLLVKLKPTHISTYSLMIEKHTKLYNEGVENISGQLDYKMYRLVCKYLKKYNYNHYEVSNFCLKGYESKHNLSYWNNKEYYGFGLGASGYIDGFRYENTSNLFRYLKEDYRVNESLLSLDDKMYDEVMLGLRKMNGINLSEFESKYNIKFMDRYDIDDLLKSKELIIKNGYLYINPKYIYVMNEILVKIL